MEYEAKRNTSRFCKSVCRVNHARGKVLTPVELKSDPFVKPVPLASHPAISKPAAASALPPAIRAVIQQVKAPVEPDLSKVQDWVDF